LSAARSNGRVPDSAHVASPPRMAPLGDAAGVLSLADCGMSETAGDPPWQYEIRVSGLLDRHWADWFAGFELHHDERANSTVLVGRLADQAALHGAIERIRALGLPLLSVRRIEHEAS